jgi:hypothetical protein
VTRPAARDVEIRREDVRREDVRREDVGRADVRRVGGRRIETDAENVERDLTRLVLTVVELVRQLVERQCLRRFDNGDLSDDQVERIGRTLMRLEEAMTELCERFGLTLADLNLDLGPLGTLLPTDPPDG